MTTIYLLRLKCLKASIKPDLKFPKDRAFNWHNFQRAFFILEEKNHVYFSVTKFGPRVQGFKYPTLDGIKNKVDEFCSISQAMLIR